MSHFYELCGVDGSTEVGLRMGERKEMISMWNSQVLLDDVFAAQNAFDEVAWALVMGFEVFFGTLCRPERHNSRCMCICRVVV